MGIIEQTIGIIIIGIGFAVGLLYVAPKTIKDVIDIVKSDLFLDDFNVAESNKSE